ncbi:MAG TPA: ribonuclease P protein subunit [Nitrososphaeraceae archaeon]|jgi:RNase P/RNase MRP subunit p29|nr:ribonuclease P protein subunit [Nitrososphaeraceae archaeon]
MILRDYITRYEFIGRNAQIDYGPTDNQRKVSGKIIFETKNTISLANEFKKYIIPKNTIQRISLIFKDEICIMNGSMILGRPEDRLIK